MPILQPMLTAPPPPPPPPPPQKKNGPSPQSIIVQQDTHGQSEYHNAHRHAPSINLKHNKVSKSYSPHQVNLGYLAGYALVTTLCFIKLGTCAQSLRYSICIHACVCVCVSPRCLCTTPPPLTDKSRVNRRGK